MRLRSDGSGVRVGDVGLGLHLGVVVGRVVAGVGCGVSRASLGGGLGLEMLLGQHVVGDANEERPQLSLLLKANLGEDELEVVLGEVRRKLADGLDEEVAPGASPSCCWSDAKNWARIVVDHLSARPLVGVSVPPGNDLKDGNPDSGGLSDQIADGVGLEKRRSLIAAVDVELAELDPDFL